MHLPLLNLCTGDAPVGESVARLWLKAVGERPDLPKWRNVQHRKHTWLHDLAVEADGYESAYEELPAEDLMAQNRYSVEHVVPRSRTDDASELEGDPYNWIMATRTENSRRSNTPLKLWPDTPGRPNAQGRFQNLDGELHYLPPPDQRARLARKWLYARATYPRDVDPPTVAQLKNLEKIVTLVRDTPIMTAERQVANELYEMLHYKNPLLTNDAADWYSTVDWHKLLSGE